MLQGPPQQTFFAEQLQQILPVYISTSYGKVFAHTAGNQGQPLIIIVHGSGPKNSSVQYNYLLHEYLKFYIIAIDCPGYGKSIGSKQAIKTFPTQLFQEILTFLGYKKYFAMFGHSQGGAAIFNAVHQKSTLTDFLVMDRPVCGNIQRFRKFHLPTLLVYDIQDDGHPIWQGKLLFKELNNSELHTYRNSKDPYWVADNIWDLMVCFFAKNSLKNRRVTTTSQDRRAPSNSRLPQKSYEQKTKQAAKQNPILKVLKSQQKRTHSLQISRKVRGQKRILNEIKFPLLGQIKETQIQKQELLSINSHSLSNGENLELQKISEQMEWKQKELLKDEQKLNQTIKPYHIDETVVIGEQIQKVDPGIFGTPENLKQRKRVNSPKNQKQTSSQTDQQDLKCSICYQLFYRPLQTNCRHVFCSKCILSSLLVDQRCPLCRQTVNKKNQRKDIFANVKAKLTDKSLSIRQKQYLKLKLMLDSVVFIEIGNNTVQIPTKQSPFTKTKKKYAWELFAREKNNFKFAYVDFDINMGNQDSRPVRRSQAPFTFENKSTFSFSCQITIKPKNNQYAPLKQTYRINIEPGTHTKKIAFRKKVYTP